MTEINPVVKIGRKPKRKKALTKKEIELKRLGILLASGIKGDEYKKVAKERLNLIFGKNACDTESHYRKRHKHD